MKNLTSDLSKAKQGDLVRFRCGGKAEIKQISVHQFDQVCCFLYFEDDPRSVPHVYGADGGQGSATGKSIFDITHINEVKVRRYATLEELAEDAEKRGISK